MVFDTTLSLETFIDQEIKEFQPHCIIADSLCFWGKLFAKKYQITFVCSTTSLAFNQYTSKLMKQGVMEIIRMFKGMLRIHKKMETLNEHGYQVESFVSIVQNDNETNTIVYTSRKFQPMVETFSDCYTFVGPSIQKIEVKSKVNQKPSIYISLGTVLNDNIKFYKECIKAFQDEQYNALYQLERL